ncbi:MAG: AAA family ATPase [Spirochaetia bacterium]|nr:AAA family ATPase [Spirochaetia bacterium]
MKPVFLTLQAFGPFARKEEIDFSKFINNGIFLIHGPTGSGKSSILDAISYALFSQTTGAERTSEEMVSQFSDIETETFVSFQFQLKNKTYRIERRPSQKKKSSRKEGPVEVQAKAALFEIMSDKEEILLASGAKIATEKIESILGFSAPQFLQTVIIPQGRFRDALIAPSNDREKILQDLFGTLVYLKVQEKFKEKEKETKLSLDNINEFKKELFIRTAISSEKELSDKCDKLTNLAKSLEEKKNKLKEEEKIIREALSKDEKLHSYFEELEALNLKFIKIKSEQKDIDNKKSLKESAQKALLIKDAYENYREIQNEIENLTLDKESISLEIKKNQTIIKSLHVDIKKLPDYQIKLENLIVTEGLLSKKISSAEEYFKLSDNHKNQEVSLKKERSKLLDKEKLFISIEKNKNEISEKLNKAKIIEASIPSIQSEIETEKSILFNLNKISDLNLRENKLIAEIKDAEKEFNELKNKLKKIKDKLSLKERQWREGQVFILSSSLKKNEPCPVCGSKAHPAPAKADKIPPDFIELEKARKEKEEFEIICAEAKENIESKKNSLESIKQAKKEILETRENIDRLEKNAILSVIHEKEKKLKESLGKIEQIINLQNEEKEIKREIEIIKKEIEELRGSVNEKNGLIKEQQALIKKLEKELSSQEREPDFLKTNTITIREETESLKTKIEEIKIKKEKSEKQSILLNEKSNAVAKNIENKKKQYHTKEAEFLKRMKDLNFIDINHFQKAFLKEDKIKKLNEEVAEFEKEAAALDKQINYVKEKIKNQKKPRLEPVKKKLNLVENEIEQCASRLSQMNANIKNIKKEYDTLQDYLKKEKKLTAEYSLIKEISDTINGTRSDKLTLQKFALSALLDEILAAASLRLKKMSLLRYELQRRRKNTEKGALELEVFDEHTGDSRRVETLSGGESFLASLSLALGLADVVESYEGGIQMDTIFIDEGFGALDSQALEEAINALIELKKEGRLVGIISHVPELKERIKSVLEIIVKSDNTSSARIRA